MRLGYRRDLAAASDDKLMAPDRGHRAGDTHEDLIIYSIPTQAWEGRPAMYVDAADLDSVPTDIRPYDPDNADLVQTVADLRAAIDEPEEAEFLTVGRLAVSYGGITYADEGARCAPRGHTSHHRARHAG